MHLSWFGQTCVKLQTKFRDEDVTVLLDPYKPTVAPSAGGFPRSFSPDLATFSRGQTGAITLSQTPLVLDTLGEIELKEIIVVGFPLTADTIGFKLAGEGINIVHLGRLASKPSPDVLENAGRVDILFVPVGNRQRYLPLADVVDIITELEPRLIIPMGYQCDTEPEAAPLSEFLKELGLKPESTDKKLILKKKDLPQADTKVIILEKVS